VKVLLVEDCAEARALTPTGRDRLEDRVMTSAPAPTRRHRQRLIALP